jgi:hypothetical protein
MRCAECDRLSRAEVEATRSAVAAESRLQDFFPEPPFGEIAAKELKRCQRASEDSRESVNLARSIRVAHAQSHSLTIAH